MLPLLFGQNEQTFKTRGLGPLEVTSCKVTEELNGGFTLEASYPISGKLAGRLMPRNIVYVKPGYADNPQAFRINKIKRSINNAVTIYANHISYDLSGYMWPGASTALSTLNEALISINGQLSMRESPYTLLGTPASWNPSGTWLRDKVCSIKSLMGGSEGSLIDVFGGEWKYDNFNCYLYQKRGTDEGVRISYGNNMAEYVKEMTDGQYTHVVFYWEKDSDRVVSVQTSTGIEGVHKVKMIDVTQEYDSKPAVTTLNSRATQYVKSNRTALTSDQQTIQVEPSILNQRIALGDTVHIWHEGITDTRVVKTVWDPLAERFDSIELGTKKENVSTTIRNLR